MDVKAREYMTLEEFLSCDNPMFSGYVLYRNEDELRLVTAHQEKMLHDAIFDVAGMD